MEWNPFSACWLFNSATGVHSSAVEQMAFSIIATLVKSISYGENPFAHGMSKWLSR
jgi:hypothetical protein